LQFEKVSVKARVGRRGNAVEEKEALRTCEELFTVRTRPNKGGYMSAGREIAKTL